MHSCKDYGTLGYREGKNVAIERRYTMGNVDPIPELTDELVRLKVEVIFAPGTAVALAAETPTTIPLFLHQFLMLSAPVLWQASHGQAVTLRG